MSRAGRHATLRIQFSTPTRPDVRSRPPGDPDALVVGRGAARQPQADEPVRRPHGPAPGAKNLDRPQAPPRSIGTGPCIRVIVTGSRADVIRQALHAGYVEELSTSIAPVVLSGGSVCSTTSHETVSLEHLRLHQSPFGAHITYRVVR
jgi:hypothetical protein